jgi:hypothetical protein
MKTKNLFYSIILLGLLSSSEPSIAGSTNETNAVFSCERIVNPTTTIHIKNRVGPLKVEGWDKNSVKVDVLVNIEGNTDQVTKAMDYIRKLNFTLSGDTLVFSTRFWKTLNSSSVGSIFNSSKGGRCKLTMDNGEEIKLTRLELSYVLTLPRKNPLILAQAYENATMTDLEGKVLLDLYECTLTAGKLPLCYLIKAKYGSVTVDSVQDVELRLYENKLNLRSAGNVKMDSKYSETKIQKCGSLNIDAYEDKITVYSHGDLMVKAKYTVLGLADFNKGTFDLYECKMTAGSGNIMAIAAKYCNISCISAVAVVFTSSYENQFSSSVVKDLKASSSYSSFHVTHLDGSLVFSSSYEDRATVTKIKKGFTAVNIAGKYSTFDLTFEPGTPYKLDVDLQYTTFEYPKTSLREIRYHKENEKLNYLGIIQGGDESTAQLIQAKMYEGSLNIK